MSNDLSQLKVGFIGAGNMSYGIVKGILKSGGINSAHVTVSAPSANNFPRFQEMGVHVVHSNNEAVSGSQLVFLAVKPHLIRTVVTEVLPHLTERHTVVSVAAGVTLETLEQLLPPGVGVVRLMPNLPCVFQEGALLFARGSSAKEETGALLKHLLSACGSVEEGPESWIDIHTGLSGSGVAFVYLFAEAMAEGAVKMGMPSALAQRIAAQTILGAGRVLRDSGKPPAVLRGEVCTPGGTTIYGLHALEKGGVRSATMSAVETATERARELGRK
ncbi:pyrroline-5-carboxylate reductase 3 isoform X1 [Engraulis encrasicolus]|uniref:pyrroline-5-carboxylate reductase 3 isoform X1 n=1 Tax=Engraulis encrasicolus TaxID=184585 RepID=UPI002FD2DE5B